MRIVIKNLPHFITEAEIHKEFSTQGEITDLFMLKDTSGKFRRVCFVGYKDEESAEKAVKKLNGIYLHNHKIGVFHSKLQDHRDISESEQRVAQYHSILFIKYLPKLETSLLEEELRKHGEISSIEFISKPTHYNCEVTYKNPEDAVNVLKNVVQVFGKPVTIKPNTKKTDSKKSEHYNTLFFNFESVINKTCENQKISKNDLVDLKDKELGSKIALLETNLVNQTNKFLLRNKIDLNNLTNEKNKKMLIVRNMEIEKCLDFMNVKGRIDVAPSKTLALLKFESEEECFKCYRNINLRRYNDTVVYCEFAPICKVEDIDNNGSSSKIDNNEENINNNEDNEENLKRTNKLLIKNLPFQATKSDVERLFKGKFNFTNVRIPKKRDGNSRGFCFVELDSEKSIFKAIEYFGKSTHLYGRRLVLERAKE
ncbi:Multiple RNA-binding domain-containing protein 1 [Nosema granulosis]|uniref:Multiple RNA-binding domain-containing protein 1 n=1 Tax=Nosema granulosis TaxID=83296 RepID=A0A9P6H1X8_9MICR|nr:Multiple RNA-binding domain-containing protein 1 [Nosema granulosis]